tara:strand:- start:321 stop:533 length:213 start_codon:yes stop_codon:yes gene_type:complete
MVKSYLPLRSINKKTGKPTGPILMAEIVKKKSSWKEITGHYFDGKNSYTIYKDARGKETMKRDKHEHTKT